MLNVPVTPPRVAFLDPRTGAISREWYMFFLSLYQNTTADSGNVEDLQKGPDVGSELSSLQHETEKALQALALAPSPPQLGTMSPMNKDFMDFIGWNQNAGVAVQPGQMAWNSGDGTLDIGMGYDGVVQQVGLENYYRIKASGNISNGDLVMFAGAVGASGVILGAKSTTGITEGLQIMGVATMDIANNGFGYVTNFGLVRGINTTGSSVGETWADGDILYYNPSYVGGMTNVRPASPNEVVIVAAVVHAGPGGSGSIFTRITFYPRLYELSDVYALGAVDGDKLVYDGATARWNNEAFSSVYVSSTAPASPRVGDVWLDTSGGSISPSGSISTKTANYTLTAADYTVLCNATSGTISITLPAASSVIGHMYNVKKIDSSANAVTVVASGATIDGSSTHVLSSQWDVVTIQTDGSNWFIL